MNIREQYLDQGYLSPVDILDMDEAASHRCRLEQAEARTGSLHYLPKIHTLLTSPAELARHPRVLDVVEEILGPDILVYNVTYIIKEARSASHVSWHQDLTYWGLDEAEEMTAWVALSPSTLASGCMQFIAGSHKRQLVAHKDSFHEDNLLTRGQEIAVEVDDADATPVLLEPGQASLHHGHLFHASGPNTTSDRRIGAALRYIKPSMKQVSGDRTVVSHVSGEDHFKHFTIAPPPTDRLQAESFELCRMDAQIKARLLFEGAEQGAGKRYK